MAVIDRIQGLLGDLGCKAPVLVATTAAITLYGEQTIDGVAVVAEDRVLVKDQADTTTNGIYYCQASTWARAPDFDGTRDAVQGTLIVVATGTANAGTIWRLTTANPVIGTSNITFSVLAPLTASAFIQSLLADADAAAARATLGAVGLTGDETIAGTKTFSTPVAIASGGHGQNTAALGFAALKQAASTSATGVVQLDTSAEIKTGTDATKVITASALLAAQGFTARYTSGNQTITSGGSLSLAHGLTRSPILVNAWLVNTTTELGYGVGSKVSISTGGLTTDVSSNHGISLAVDVSLVGIRYGSNANVFFLPNASTGALALATNGNWKLVIEAFA